MSHSHGVVKISLTDNVITAIFIGSFNYEAAHDYFTRIKSIVTSLKEQPFVMLLDATKFEGATPEAFEELNAYNTWLNQTQIKAKALINNSGAKQEIIASRTPSLSLQNTGYFSSYEKANEWLDLYR